MTDQASGPVDFEALPAFMNDHPGQQRIWDCKAETIAVVCGAQSGKTVAGPWWLLREIGRCGPGEYAVGSARYDLMITKLLPAYAQVLVDRLGLGRLIKSGAAARIELSPEGMARLGWNEGLGAAVFFRTLSQPNQWESMTCLAIHSDESGQSGVPEATFEAQERRLAVARSRGKGQGRHLITSTPYEWNWFKHRIADRADGSKIGLVQFPSWCNPTFNKSVADEALAGGMMEWRWRMMYEGVFTRPSGAVFDCWTPARNLRPLAPSARTREVVLGVDFGPVNMAYAVVAKEDGHWVVAETKCPLEGSDEDRAAQMLAACRRHGRLVMAAGGAPSEDEWRLRMAASGLDIARPPLTSVDSRVANLYRLFKTGRLAVSSRLAALVHEIENYQYVVDDDGNKTDVIDKKSTFHRIDALGYAMLAAEPFPMGESAAPARYALQEWR